MKFQPPHEFEQRAIFETQDKAHKLYALESLTQKNLGSYVKSTDSNKKELSVLVRPLAQNLNVEKILKFPR